jgi:hypothetical protein
MKVKKNFFVPSCSSYIVNVLWTYKITDVMKKYLKFLKLTVCLLFAAPFFLYAQNGMDASEVIIDWLEESKKVAETMLEKYGEPNGVTDMMLVWQDAVDWKRIIVSKEPVPHYFPMKHMDVVE